MRNTPTLTELTELVPLAFQVLRFKMLDAHRKSLRRGEYNQESVDDLPLADPGDDPATQLDQKQRVDRLLAAMAQLGERCRELFKWKLEGNAFPRFKRSWVRTRSTRSIPGTYAAESSCSAYWEALGNEGGAIGRLAFARRTRAIRLSSFDARSSQSACHPGWKVQTRKNDV